MHHDWSEEDFDWNALNNAGYIIWWICTHIGRIGIHVKEKWGVLRADTYFWYGSLHGLIFPGHVYSRFPKWLWKLDCLYITPFVQFLRFPTFLFFQYQKFIYGLAYYIAMKKYPHIREEICEDADYPQFIVGGKKIHDKYWITHTK